MYRLERDEALGTKAQETALLLAYRLNNAQKLREKQNDNGRV